MNVQTVQADLARRLKESGFPQDGIQAALHSRHKFLGDKTPVQVVMQAPDMTGTVIALMAQAGASCLQPGARGLTP